MTLDETDRQLLRAVQDNAQLTAQDLGERLNLSASQAGRRRQRLEQTGIIEGARAVVSPEGVGLRVQAFVQVQMATHDPAQVRDFTRTIDLSPEIVSAWTLTGEADFLLRVYCADLSALHRRVHEVILPNPAVARVQSQIVMDQQKPDAPLPT